MDILGLPHVRPSVLEQLGKVSEGYQPPIRVHFSSEAIATTVLKNAWKLKRTHYYTSVYIAPDRTVAERNDRAKLVEQLKENIKHHPKTKWVIRRGKVVDDGEWKKPEDSKI